MGKFGSYRPQNSLMSLIPSAEVNQPETSDFTISISGCLSGNGDKHPICGISDEDAENDCHLR